MFRKLAKQLAKKRLSPKQVRHLEVLEQIASVGVQESAFMSCHDERNTKFERDMDAKTLSLKAARIRVLTQIDDMPHAVFISEVKW